MINLFAFRATKPAIMMKDPNPIGPENDETIIRLASRASLVIACWGTNGDFMGRADMEQCGLDIEDVSDFTRLDPKVISAILDGNATIGRSIALCLSCLPGAPPDHMWLTLEKNYRDALAKGAKVS